jgi:hypothetical protein
MKRIDFNQSWTFCKKGGVAREITLPHDAMIEEQRCADSPGGNAYGYFPGGVYVYEKRFTLPEAPAGRHIVLQFEGVYKNSTVTINGKEAGGKPYGYIPFFVETDGLLNDGENIIRVVADNADLPASRWYTGSGIYRPVWLWAGGRSYIEPEGIKITTLSVNPAKIKVNIAHNGGSAAFVIRHKGVTVAEGAGDETVVDIPAAYLWSDETPELYECAAVLTENGEIIDEAAVTFGIRMVEWSNKGLFINGRETLLRGTGIHHDNGILGARSTAESEERRVRILKQAGYNAIRSAHNPASSALLAACDKHGMYVMDETWDMWYASKNKYDYAKDFYANYLDDIRAMVSRDYNHPCVIMYSIGNEVSEPCDEKGLALAKEMIDYIHSLDHTRAITCGINLWIFNRTKKGKAMYREDGGLSVDNVAHNGKKLSERPINSTLFNIVTSVMGSSINNAANGRAADAATSPCLDLLDIAGYNYASGRYPLEGWRHPNRVIVGTETFSYDIAKNWEMVKKYPYLIGDFMWIAWDYIGEAGIGVWSSAADAKMFFKPYPWLLAGSGAIDILGNPGAEAAYAGIVWGIRKTPYIGVRPVNHTGTLSKSAWRWTNAIASWSWRGCEQRKTTVEVYADCAGVALMLNDKIIGRKKIKQFKALFNVRYTPGALTAIAFDADGREISRHTLTSSDGKIHITVAPELDTVRAGQLAYVNIGIAGENGIIESNADAKLTVSVEGGRLLAFGSATPRTEERYTDGVFTTYYGRALAVVTADRPGVMVVTVQGENLPPVKAEIVVEE